MAEWGISGVFDHMMPNSVVLGLNPVYGDTRDLLREKSDLSG